MTMTTSAGAHVLAGLDLPILRARVTLRLLDATTLPPYKGALLRGGFGYAFQRAACPQPCWGHSATCAVGTLCPYRWIFETPHPPGVAHLHDLHDVPRPFVIEPPLDHKRQYAAGDALEFGLVLLGRAIDHLPYFLFSFEQLGRMGLGRDQARARLERVEALRPWEPTGLVVYQDGRVTAAAAQLADADDSYIYSAATIAARAMQLPADLRLTLSTPLRVKTRGVFIETFDLGAIMQAACWRLNALATFHGGGPWAGNHRALAEQARAIAVEQARVQWVDWERTSTRAAQPRSMKLGGIIGSTVLRDVPPDVRAVLLAGSLVHVGKAAVFGHGKSELQRA
jgi:CRISPR-associated endoribonuclease Cas6